jgi:uncharacterized hydrophobic protein (TIGR00271 family)
VRHPDPAAPATHNGRVLHVQIITSAQRAEQVLELLQHDPTVVNVVHLPGAAHKPLGDVIIGDVARESADELITHLTDMGIDTQGSITVTPIDVMLSSAARRAEALAPGHGSDALVWSEVLTRVANTSVLSFSFLTLMGVATLLGALGAIYDNAILVVGAMVAGPEYGALAAISVGLVRRQRWLTKRGAVSLIVGFAAAIVGTTIILAGLNALDLIDITLLEEARPNTEFIYQPDSRSLVVAILAGIVGTISLTSASSTTLVGVLISVTTIPAAGNAAAALVDGDLSQATGSLVQLGINLFGIIVAGVLTLLVQEQLWKRYGRPRLARVRERDQERRDRIK